MDKIAITKRAIRIKVWEKMYEEYQSSGMKVKDWCNEQGLSIKTKVLMQVHYATASSNPPNSTI